MKSGYLYLIIRWKNKVFQEVTIPVVYAVRVIDDRTIAIPPYGIFSGDNIGEALGSFMKFLRKALKKSLNGVSYKSLRISIGDFKVVEEEEDIGDGEDI